MTATASIRQRGPSHREFVHACLASRLVTNQEYPLMADGGYERPSCGFRTVGRCQARG